MYPTLYDSAGTMHLGSYQNRLEHSQQSGPFDRSTSMDQLVETHEPPTTAISSAEDGGTQATP